MDHINLLANDSNARVRIEAILTTNEEFKAAEQTQEDFMFYSQYARLFRDNALTESILVITKNFLYVISKDDCKQLANPVPIGDITEFIWSPPTYKYGCAFKVKDLALLGQSHLILDMQAGLQELRKFLGSAKEKLKLNFHGPLILPDFEVDFRDGSMKHFKFTDLDPEAQGRKVRGGLATNPATSGWVFKKSGSWTEYFRLWGGSVTWKKKFLLATNLGLLIFDESQIHNLRKPKKFISAIDLASIS